MRERACSVEAEHDYRKLADYVGRRRDCILRLIELLVFVNRAQESAVCGPADRIDIHLLIARLLFLYTEYFIAGTKDISDTL